MATQIIKTVGTGGDYSTWLLWEAAVTADMVTADEQWTGWGLEVESPTSSLTINGHTGSATCYLEMSSHPNFRHQGISNDQGGPTRHAGYSGANVASGVGCISIQDEYFRATWLDFAELVGSAGNRVGFSCTAINAGGSDIRIENNIIHGNKSGTSANNHGININDADAVVSISNNLIYGFTGNGINWAACAPASTCYNNTVVLNGHSSTATFNIAATDTDVRLAGNYCGGPNTAADDYSFGAGTDAGFNVSSDTTGSTGFQEYDDYETYFTGYDNGDLDLIDLRLIPGAALIDLSTNLGEQYKVDVAGRVRDGKWSAGAYEYVQDHSSRPWGGGTGGRPHNGLGTHYVLDQTRIGKGGSRFHRLRGRVFSIIIGLLTMGTLASCASGSARIVDSGGATLTQDINNLKAVVDKLSATVSAFSSTVTTGAIAGNAIFNDSRLVFWLSTMPWLVVAVVVVASIAILGYIAAKVYRSRTVRNTAQWCLHKVGIRRSPKRATTGDTNTDTPCQSRCSCK